MAGYYLFRNRELNIKGDIAPAVLAIDKVEIE